MSETPANPFASPADVKIADYTAPSHQSKSIGRWIGLSVLSGVLLFAAYFVTGIAVCVVATILLISPEGLFASEFLMALGIYCAVGGIYGLMIGCLVGMTFGTMIYWMPTRNGVSTLYAVGLPFALLATIFLPGGYLLVIYWSEPTFDLSMLWGWTAILGLFALIAATHLTFNIRRFLIKPLEEAQNGLVSL